MKKKNYYPESYKEKSNPHPTESGRKLRKGKQTQNEPELLIDNEGNAYYSEHNKKEEIQNVFSEETAYDREKELLEAIDNSQDDNEIPERVKVAETHNEIKERFDNEENEKYKKYDKYKDYKGNQDIQNDEQEDENITDTTDTLVTENIEEDEAENKNCYYERKISKAKSNDDRNIDYKQKNFNPNKNPNKDRRHGKEKHGSFKRSNRSERQYTKRKLKEILR